MSFMKEGAVRILIRDARSGRTSFASYKRVVKALKTLGLNALERQAILTELEYVRADGTVYPRFLRISYNAGANV